jgi:hypothetical protein
MSTYIASSVHPVVYSRLGAAECRGHWYPAASLNLYPNEDVKSSKTAGPREPTEVSGGEQRGEKGRTNHMGIPWE